MPELFYLVLIIMQKRKLTKEQALQKLRHYCGYQERCLSEVKNKLYELGINKNEHDEMIRELVKEEYLNEERFARAFAVGKFKIKEWGRKKIEYALKEKMVNSDTIQTALRQILEEEYVAILQKLAGEKFESLNSEQEMIRKKKTMQYLLQRGFEFDLVRATVGSISN